MYKHEHKYFAYNTKAEFEPVVVPNPDNAQLYQRVEYLISGCNCGAGIKMRLIEDDYEPNA